MACAMLFTVSAQTYLQRATPPHLLGKVASFVAAISTCAMPLGQALYGLLFDALQALSLIHIFLVYKSVSKYIVHGEEFAKAPKKAAGEI